MGEAEGGVDLGRLERLAAGHLGQDRGDPTREHGLARAGWAGEQDIVPAGDGDLERRAGEALAAHLGHVDLAGARRRWFRRRRGAHRALAAQRRDDLGEVGDGVDGDAVDDGGLGCARGRQDDAPQAGRAGAHGRGEHAAHRADGSVEAELADHEQARERGVGDHALGGQHGEGDRQVEAAAGLAQVGGREVDGDLLERQIVADGLERALDPRRAFLHRRRGQADDAVLRQSAIDRTFDVDELGVDADQGAGGDSRDHAPERARCGPALRRVRSTGSPRTWPVAGHAVR